ncbi:MAG: hypothetical protein JKY28_05885 [Sulfurimonas sp.]|nr:hypothetical protein [Sulfurimonas sp.]
MLNPFESGQIRNYVLAYASIVVIMVLFFTAATLFHEIESVEKKVFVINKAEAVDSKSDEKQEKKYSLEFRLMDEKIY